MPGLKIVIPANSAQPIVRVQRSRSPRLSELQAEVDGPIQMVPGFDRFESSEAVCYCNEEGLLHELPLNSRASAAWLDSLGPGPFSYPPQLLGDVVVLVGDGEFLA